MERRLGHVGALRDDDDRHPVRELALDSLASSGVSDDGRAMRSSVRPRGRVRSRVGS
jgi:hypothetical protein